MLVIDMMFSFQKHLKPKQLSNRFIFTNLLTIFTPTNPGGFLIFTELLNNPNILLTLGYLTKSASKAQLQLIGGGSFTK